MWTHFSCNFLLHEISLVADWVFESRLMQLHSSYARNGLISWRIASLRPGHALSIYFVIIVGLWYSRWELDLFVTLSAEAIDLVPWCRCRLQSESWLHEPASQTVCAVKVMFSTAPTLQFSSSRNQFGCWLSVWKPSNAAAFSAISILRAYWFDKLKNWLFSSGTCTFYLLCHNCWTLVFAVRAWFICHSLCRGDWLGAQVSLVVRHLRHVQPLSKGGSNAKIRRRKQRSVN